MSWFLGGIVLLIGSAAVAVALVLAGFRNPAIVIGLAVATLLVWFVFFRLGKKRS